MVYGVVISQLVPSGNIGVLKGTGVIRQDDDGLAKKL